MLRAAFPLHAATRIAGPDRRGLERLCRYVARPALVGGRLRILDADHLSFALKTPWPDGSSHLLLSPMELLEKLAALVPPPRFHLLRYHGVLAPRAHLLSSTCGPCSHRSPPKVNGMALMMDESKTYGLGNELILEKLRGVPAEE